MTGEADATLRLYTIQLDPWQAAYGLEVMAFEATTEAADVDLEVEQAGAWSPIAPGHDSAAGLPQLVYFVDGVRRVDARIVGSRDGGALFHGAFGSYAVGAVEAWPARHIAVFTTGDLGRVIATGSGELLPGVVDVSQALAYLPVSAAGTDPVAPERAIHDEMRRAEERMARELAARDALVVTDGPLTFQDATRGLAVGWIKRIEEIYVPATHVSVLHTLPAGTRTPLFAGTPPGLVGGWIA